MSVYGIKAIVEKGFVLTDALYGSTIAVIKRRGGCV